MPHARVHSAAGRPNNRELVSCPVNFLFDRDNAATAAYGARAGRVIAPFAGAWSDWSADAA